MRPSSPRALEPPPDAVVFDFDGVLIDSRAPVREALAAALTDHGYTAPPAHELDRFLGPPTMAALAELAGEPEESAAVCALTHAYHGHYGRVYLEQTTLIDGVAGALGELRVPLALATSKPADFTEPLLRHLRIRDRFAVVCAPAGDNLGERKPATLGRAIAALGARAPAMVGDRHFDVEAARANGVRAIGVTWGIGDRDELAAAGADLIVDRPSELIRVLGVSG